MKHLVKMAVLTVFLAANASAGELSGKITSVGSDTLAGLMAKWSAKFSEQHPGVSFDITAEGSSTAPPALMDGTSSLGPMSRKMKAKEVDAFTSRHGYKPTAVRVAIDGLAVYVHKDNPLAGMDLSQVDAIFSANRKCGMAQDISSWSGVGADGALANQGIEIYGRDNKSGTHGFFAKKALCKGEFRAGINEVPHSETLVDEVGGQLNAIGYSGMGYKTDEVRILPLAKKPGQPFVEASTDNIANGSYPLARFLYIYVNKKPGQPLGEMERTFLEFVMSGAGQEIVAAEGFVTLPDKIKTAHLNKLKQ